MALQYQIALIKTPQGKAQCLYLGTWFPQEWKVSFPPQFNPKPLSIKEIAEIVQRR